MFVRQLRPRMKPAPHVSGCSLNLRLRPLRGQSHLSMRIAAEPTVNRDRQGWVVD